MEFLNEMYSTLVKSAPLIITAVIVFAVGMGAAYLLNKAIRKALELSLIHI